MQLVTTATAGTNLMSHQEDEPDESSMANTYSPSQVAMSGHDFTPEDIQALLGGVVPDSVSASDPDPVDSVFTPSSGPPATDEDTRNQARIERKRKLEKQRRSDVNKQFSELQGALRRLESEDPEEVRGLPAYTPSNRVDLIARTVALLHHLHDNNKRRKAEIADLKQQLERSTQAGEETASKLKDAMMAPQVMGNNKVMMMVPMLIGGDSTTGAAVPMMQPWMPGFNMGASGSRDGYADPASTTSSQRPAVMPWMPPAMPWVMQPSPSAGGTGTDGKHAASVKEPAQGNLAHCA